MANGSPSYVLIWLICGVLVHYIYTRIRGTGTVTLPIGVLIGVHQQYKRPSDQTEHGRRVIYGSNQRRYKLRVAELQDIVNKCTPPVGTHPMQIQEKLEWHNT